MILAPLCLNGGAVVAFCLASLFSCTFFSPVFASFFRRLISPPIGSRWKFVLFFWTVLRTSSFFFLFLECTGPVLPVSWSAYPVYVLPVRNVFLRPTSLLLLLFFFCFFYQAHPPPPPPFFVFFFVCCMFRHLEGRCLGVKGHPLDPGFFVLIPSPTIHTRTLLFGLCGQRVGSMFFPPFGGGPLVVASPLFSLRVFPT